MKKMPKPVAIVLAIFLCLILIKDLVIKTATTVVASGVVGAPVHIDSFSLGIFKSAVRINGLKIYNPEGFPAGILVDIPKIYVDYNLGDVFKGKIHLRTTEVRLKEIGLIKNKDGRLNADSLKVVKQDKKPGHQEKQVFLKLDLVKVYIGRVVYKDYAQGPSPMVRVYDLGIEKEYKNITSAQQLAALIISEPMKAAGIQGAKIYAVSALAGAAILPVAVAATLIAKDYAQETMRYNPDKVYQAALKVLRKSGSVTNENKNDGKIAAAFQSASINVEIKKIDNNTEVTISAREFLMPKPEIAAGVIYLIDEELK